jgi:hypothetical protein
LYVFRHSPPAVAAVNIQPVRPSRDIIVFLLGGITIAAITYNWRIVFLLSIFLALSVALVLMRSLFTPPGKRD